MTRLRSLLTLPLLTALIFAYGCSDKEVDPGQNNDENLNLTDEFGGYSSANEQPAFGDEEMSDMDVYMSADDPMITNHDVDSIRILPNVGVYAVQLLWGHLEHDSTETQITDWSGSISVDLGAIIALRLIRFEQADYIVRPRTSRQVIDFVSHTDVDFDGILVYVYDPNPLEHDSENVLTITTGPYTNSFAMHELVDIETITDVGNNQFSINAFKLEHIECGEGFLEGKWVRPASDRGKGTFVGRWFSQDGLLLGHVHGHFGTRDDNAQVMFGKWISAAGLFRGFLRGEWTSGTEEDPADTENGSFAGSVYNRDRVVIGDYSGDWSARERGNDDKDGNRAKHGFFRGQWSTNCD